MLPALTQVAQVICLLTLLVNVTAEVVCRIKDRERDSMARIAGALDSIGIVLFLLWLSR